MAANHVKPEAASGIENDWAFELIKHYDGSCSEESLGERLCKIISLLMSGISADFLIRDHAIALAHSVCQMFAYVRVTAQDFEGQESMVGRFCGCGMAVKALSSIH